MASLPEYLSSSLREREAKNLYRARKILDSAQGVQVVVDGKPCLSFCSNDYLGLANHPDVIEAFKRGADQYGAGSGASHLVSGHSRAHQQLEEELAAFTGREKAMLFSSGYMANIGVISALVGKGDFIFEDKLNHASLIDAGLLSGGRFQRYLHTDVNSLEKYLLKAEGSNKLVVTDGVFSMDGDIAPLPGISSIAKRHNAWLMVDDAHGFGVLGKTGAGTLEYCDLSAREVPILMGTLGKAFGTAGAFVAGSHDLIEYLIQFARTYIYTTALPPAIAEATRASLALVKTGEQRAQQHHNIAVFRKLAHERNLPLMESTTAIQPLIVGDSAAVMCISATLLERGFLVGAIRPPTVPEGSARLRITLCADHTKEQMENLLDNLQQVLGG